LVKKPTCTIATEESGCAASVWRSSVTASGTRRRRRAAANRVGTVFILHFDTAFRNFPGSGVLPLRTRRSDLAAAIEGVDEIHECDGIGAILGERHGEQLALAAALERVQHGERERIIHVVADIVSKMMRCGSARAMNAAHRARLSSGRSIFIRRIVVALRGVASFPRLGKFPRGVKLRAMKNLLLVMVLGMAAFGAARTVEIHVRRAATIVVGPLRSRMRPGPMARWPR